MVIMLQMISLCRQPSIALPLCPLQEQQVSWLEQAVSQACDAIFSSAGLCVSFSFFPLPSLVKALMFSYCSYFYEQFGRRQQMQGSYFSRHLETRIQTTSASRSGKIHLAPEVLLPPLYPTPQNQVNIGQQEDKFNYLLSPPLPFPPVAFE